MRIGKWAARTQVWIDSNQWCTLADLFGDEFDALLHIIQESHKERSNEISTFVEGL